MEVIVTGRIIPFSCIILPAVFACFSQPCEPPCRSGYACVDGRCVSECNPPCRVGYTCVNGECISLCNPPCPPGSQCDATVGDCVPAVGQQQATVPEPYDRCHAEMIRIGRECLSPHEAHNAGLAMLLPHTILYGIGSLYTGVAGIIWARAGWHEPYSSYSYYEPGYYNSFEVTMAQAPQSSMFVTFGAIAQVPKATQARYLRHLGGEPATGLMAAGWALYGFSIATSTLSILSFEADDQTFSTIAAITNSAVLGASFAVHIVGYLIQRDRLGTALETYRGTQAGARVSLVPYAYFGERSGAGLIFRL